MAPGHYIHQKTLTESSTNHSVADIHGAGTNTTHNIKIKPVNAPESKPISFKIETDELDTATVSLEKLLSGSFDIDGDQLSVRNVKTSNGGAAAENKDGSWSINTKGESGEYKLVLTLAMAIYHQAEATVSVKHKPLFTTFEF